MKKVSWNLSNRVLRKGKQSEDADRFGRFWSPEQTRPTMPRNFYVFCIALNKMSRRFALAVIEPMNDEDQILIAGEIARLSRQTVETNRNKAQKSQRNTKYNNDMVCGFEPKPKELP
jgi:hypothetical protein